MISLEDVREDCMAVLLPQYNHDQEAIGYLEQLCTWIFETHLKEEFRKKKNWPKKGTMKPLRNGLMLNFIQLFLTHMNLILKKKLISTFHKTERCTVSMLWSSLF